MTTTFLATESLAIAYRNNNALWQTGYVTGGCIQQAAFEILDSEFSALDQQSSNRALAKLHEDIQSNTAVFSGGTFLGELGSTVRMLKRPGMALRNGLSDYLREASKLKRKLRLLKGTHEALTGMWLEYTYGWKPLVQDIDGLCETLVEMNSEAIRRSSAKGHKSTERATNSVSRIYYVTTVVQADRTTFDLWRSRYIYRAGLQFTASIPAANSAARLLQLSGLDTMREFIPTAWNLMPWSFVVDYFTNIGEILQSTATDTSVVRWVNVTRVRERLQIVQEIIKNGYEKDPTFYQFYTGGGMNRGYVMSRAKSVVRNSTALTIPSLVFTMPPQGSTRWINLAALASQLAIANRR